MHREAGCAGGSALGTRWMCLSPRHVGRAGPVAGLARYHHLGPGRGVAVLANVVIFAKIGRMALRALVVPGLLPSGPVQRVRRSERLSRIEVKPALAAC